MSIEALFRCFDAKNPRNFNFTLRKVQLALLWTLAFNVIGMPRQFDPAQDHRHKGHVVDAGLDNSTPAGHIPIRKEDDNAQNLVLDTVVQLDQCIMEFLQRCLVYLPICLPIEARNCR